MTPLFSSLAKINNLYTMNSKRVQVHSSAAAAATSRCRAVGAAAATADNNSRFVSSLIIMIHT